MRPQHIVTLVTLAALGACSEAPPAKFCESGGTLIDAGFDGGNFYECRFTNDGTARITIRPEDAPPINRSAWFGFRVSGDTPVAVELVYEDGYARYWPKLSHDRRTWTRADEEDVVIAEDENSMTLTIDSNAPEVWVSGQELLTGDYYADWIAQMAALDYVRVERLGRSAMGQPIHVARTADRREYVFLIGRQHPPEVTGALAMRSFIDTVLSDSELARRFRERYAVIVIPLINPDGVDLGHWRHNVNGVDLNRDWGPFEQPETRGAGKLLEELDAAGRRPALMLDFHSTWRSLFYTQLAEETSWPIDFATVWFERFRARRPNFVFEHDPRPRSDQPNTKNFFFDRYRIPAITYEIADEEDRAAIADTTPVFAEEMMRLLLEYSAEEQTANRDNPIANEGRPPPLPLP